MWSAYGTAAHCGAIAKRATGAAALAATIAVRTQCVRIVGNDERGAMAIGDSAGDAGVSRRGRKGMGGDAAGQCANREQRFGDAFPAASLTLRSEGEELSRVRAAIEVRDGI